MNINDVHHFLYEKMKVSLLQYKDNIRWNKIMTNPLTKNMYATLEKFLKEINSIQETHLRNFKIATTFKWYKQALKETENTHKRLRHTNLNFHYPFQTNDLNNIQPYSNTINNNNNSKQTPVKKTFNFTECFQTTKRNFSFQTHNNKSNTSNIPILNNSKDNIKTNINHQKWFNDNNVNTQLLSIRSYRNRERNERPNISRKKTRTNDLYVINAPIYPIKPINRQLSINTDKNDKNNDVKNTIQNEMNTTKRKRFFKRFKIKKTHSLLSKPTIPKKETKSFVMQPRTANSKTDDKIIDVIRGIKLKMNVNNDEYDNDTLTQQNDFDRKTFYNENYKLTPNKLDYRKTISNFKHVELKSLHDYLKHKKRKFNSKALRDAFINPEYKPQATFCYPQAGSGLLSKPDFLD